MTGPGWPNERGWLVIVATVLFVYVLSLLAFVPRLEESQLFAALAGGVVGAILRDVFGMWTASTKAGAEMAQKAIDKLPDHSGGGNASAAQAADAVATAASDEADRIRG